MKPYVAEVASALGLPVRRNRTSCPIHQGSNPQSLSFKREQARCFACGWSGDAIALIQTLEGASFPDALQRLEHLGFDTRAWDHPLPSRKRRGNAKPTPPSPADLWRQVLQETRAAEEELALLKADIAEGIGRLRGRARMIRQVATEQDWDALHEAADADRAAEQFSMALDQLLAEWQWRGWYEEAA